MTGWIIVNSFINLNKFQELYSYLKISGEKLSIQMFIKRTDELICYLDDNFSSYTLPDFVIFYDKDIYLAKRLEEAGVKVFNSSNAILLCDNKILTYHKLNGKVRIPKTIIVPKTFEGFNYNNFTFLDNIEKIINYPFIIKEAYGSFGQQVYLVYNKDEAITVFNKIGFNECLVQEYISTSCGKDVRINVVGDKVVAAILRYNEHDFRSNISNGGKMINYTPTKEQADIAIKAVKALGCDFAGVDVLFGENDEPIICELNSNPHFKSTLVATGVNMADEILTYIKSKITC